MNPINGESDRPLCENGPRIVAIGGGHGLARSLGAARRFASQITAIVSVADDGGSSGRLRDALGIGAPGDIRMCLGALLPSDNPLGRALEHRFDHGELEGHAFGNLLIAALVATAGDFVQGIAEVCQVLGVVGAVLPATSCPVVLKAEGDGAHLQGQVNIAMTGGVSTVSVVPPDAPSPAQAVEAIMAADEIIIGPGSLYTSVLAALVPPMIRRAVQESPATKVYVANLREQVPETSGYDIGRHLQALLAHGITPDVVCADVSGIDLGEIAPGVQIVELALCAPSGLVHDEDRLASVLVELARS